MSRSLTAAAAAILCLPLGGGALAEPPSPTDRLAEIEAAQSVARAAYDAAEEGNQQALAEFYRAVDANSLAAIELAERYSDNPVALAALRFAIRTSRGGPGDGSRRAMEVLLRDHAAAPGMGEVCNEIFAYSNWPMCEELILAVMDRHPDRADRGRACYAYAQYLLHRAHQIKRMMEEAEQRQYIARNQGEEAVARLMSRSPDSLRQQAEEVLERCVDDFGDVTFLDAPLSEWAAGDLFALRQLGIGTTLPEIVGQDVEGRELKLSDLRGKVVVLTFFSSWCGGCKEMYPQLRELHSRSRDVPLEVLTVYSDSDGRMLKESITAGDITWRCWWDAGRVGPISRQLGIQKWPTTYILDRDGVIRSIDPAADDLRQAIDSSIGSESKGDIGELLEANE